MYLNDTSLFIKSDPEQTLGKLAAKIAYYNFEWRFVTIVMFNTVQAIGLQVFLKYYQESLIVKFGRFIPQHRVPVHQFVIFGEEATGIASTLNWLVESKYDTNAIYLIICAGAGNVTCEEQTIFKALARNYIINVIVLKLSDETNKPLAYSYKIVARGNCKNSKPHLIDFTGDCYDDKCFKSIFRQKLLNFHGCRLVMSTLEQPPFMYLHNGTKRPSGADGDLMRLVADMLNATLVLKTPSDNIQDCGHYTNNNWTGSLGDIYNTRVHASVCSAPLSANKYGNFQISFEYYSMDIVWAAKLPAKKASWEKLLHPLNIHLRFILLFTFICIILLNTFMNSRVWRKIRKSLKLDPQKHNLLFYSWIIFLGMPIHQIPIKRSFLILVYAWIWFCFVIRSAYQAGLIDSLKYPLYEDNLKSFQEVLEEGHPYGGVPALREFYTNDPEIYDNWICLDIKTLASTLDEILDGTSNFVIASDKVAIQHRIMRYNHTKQLQIIPGKIVNSPTVVYFKRYSPLTTPLNYILWVAYEGGFIQRLYKRYLRHDRILLKRSTTHGSQILTMEHFAGCFVILILGWVLAFVYFLVELVCGNVNNKEQTK